MFSSATKPIEAQSFPPSNSAVTCGVSDSYHSIAVNWWRFDSDESSSKKERRPARSGTPDAEGDTVKLPHYELPLGSRYRLRLDPERRDDEFA